MTTKIFGLIVAVCAATVVVCTLGLGVLSGHASCTGRSAPGTDPTVSAVGSGPVPSATVTATVTAAPAPAGSKPPAVPTTWPCTTDGDEPDDERDVAPADYRVPARTSPVAAVAITWALAQLGTPYTFGGDCTAPHSGIPARQCDCSSLMQIAYRHAGVSIPRTTTEQVHAGTGVPAADIAPGDLVFIPGSGGTRSRPGHVGMYLGAGLLIQAPHTGDVVKISPLSRWRNQIAAIRRVVE